MLKAIVLDVSDIRRLFDDQAMQIPEIERPSFILWVKQAFNFMSLIYVDFVISSNIELHEEYKHSPTKFEALNPLYSLLRQILDSITLEIESVSNCALVDSGDILHIIVSISEQ